MRKSERQKGVQIPDPEKCRTGKVGAVIPGSAREMFYCRIDNEECRFAMPFGFEYLCQHLNNHQFLIPEDESEDHGRVIAMFIPDTPARFIKR